MSEIIFYTFVAIHLSFCAYLAYKGIYGMHLQKKWLKEGNKKEKVE